MTIATGGATGCNSSITVDKLSAVLSATVKLANATTYTLLLSYGGTFSFTGTDFLYSGGAPVSGTITGFSETNSSGATVQTWTSCSVSWADFWSEMIAAQTSGNLDRLNSLFFSGDDSFNMQASTSFDFLYGYGGNDTFSYAGNMSGFTNIDGGPGFNTLNLNGDYDEFHGYGLLGYVKNIQLVNLAASHNYYIGASPTTAMTFDASTLGAANTFTLNVFAATGAITAKGGAGNDTVIAGPGALTFNAGDGTDTIDYTYAKGAISVDLSKTAVQSVGGGLGAETLTSIENIVCSRTGGSFAGNAGDNYFALGDNNTIWGQTPYIYTIDGGAGSNTVRFGSAAMSGEKNGITALIQANGVISVTGPFGNATLTSVQTVIGTGWGDTFIVAPGNSSGNYTIDGRMAQYPEIVVFLAKRSAYTVTNNSDGSVTVVGPSGNATLKNILQIKFAPIQNDANGDGYSDIFWQNDSGQAAIWTMNGFNQLGGSPVGGNPGTSWHMVGTGDFNGDGTADILWQNDNGAANIWTMNGFTQLGGSYVGGNPGTSWHIKGTGDFNGDGKADILWQNDSGQAAIWTMNGLTQLGGSEVGINPGAAWHIKGTGDFNGDGKSDILWQNDNGQATIWLMDGFNVMFGSSVGGNPGTSWHVIGAGDFNGDGKSDILWQNDSGQAAIWTMDGLAQTGGSPVGGNPGPTWHAKAAGDYNGDGKADILWQNDSGQTAVWTMNGLTQLGGSLVGGNPGTTWHIPTGVG